MSNCRLSTQGHGQMYLLQDFCNMVLLFLFACFRTLLNNLPKFYYIHCCMYHGSSERKCQWYWKVNILLITYFTLNPKINNTKANIRLKCIAKLASTGLYVTCTSVPWCTRCAIKQVYHVRKAIHMISHT